MASLGQCFVFRIRCTIDCCFVTHCRKQSKHGKHDNGLFQELQCFIKQSSAYLNMKTGGISRIRGHNTALDINVPHVKRMESGKSM